MLAGSVRCEGDGGGPIDLTTAIERARERSRKRREGDLACCWAGGSVAIPWLNGAISPEKGRRVRPIPDHRGVGIIANVTANHKVTPSSTLIVVVRDRSRA